MLCPGAPENKSHPWTQKGHGFELWTLSFEKTLKKQMGNCLRDFIFSEGDVASDPACACNRSIVVFAAASSLGHFAIPKGLLTKATKKAY